MSQFKFSRESVAYFRTGSELYGDRKTFTPCHIQANT